MAYSSNLKLYTNFNDYNVKNQVDNSEYDVAGESAVSYLGMPVSLQLKDEQYFSTDFSFSCSDEFSLAFKLKSFYNGLKFNESNYIDSRFPLFEIKNDFYLLKIFEINNVNNKTQLGININDQYYVYSNEYSEEFNNFFINYNSSTSDLNIYINGDLSISSVSGAFVSNISFATANMYINFKNDLDFYNTSLLEYITVFNEYIDDISAMQNIINNGILYFIDSNYSDETILNNNYLFDNPTGINVNAIEYSNDNMYLVRNDGKILIGDIKIWDKKYIFYQKFDKDILPSNVSVNENGFLILNSKTMEL